MKDRAVDTLNRMGLSVSDVIRLTLLRIAEEGRLPFDIEIPNKTTRRAITELEEDKGIHAESVEAMFEDLDI